jgi:dATP pyrophosphohydrolase
MDIRQEIPIKSFSIAAYICKVEGGVCWHLIIRRSSQRLGGTWQMVSGRIEAGETGWQAALREIHEETGLVPDRFYSANVLESFYDASQNCINLIPVFVAFIESNQTVQVSDEHSAYKWVTHNEAETYLNFDHQKEMLKTIERQFVEKAPNEALRIKI